MFAFVSFLKSHMGYGATVCSALSKAEKIIPPTAEHVAKTLSPLVKQVGENTIKNTVKTVAKDCAKAAIDMGVFIGTVDAGIVVCLLVEDMYHYLAGEIKSEEVMENFKIHVRDAVKDVVLCVVGAVIGQALIPIALPVAIPGFGALLGSFFISWLFT